MNRNRKTKRILIYVLILAGVLLVLATNVNADFAFGEPENLGPNVNSQAPSDHEWNPRMSADGLGLSVFRDSDGEFQVWIATRESKHDPWDPAIRDVAAEGPSTVLPGVTTMDGLEFYGPWYDLPEGYGDIDLYFKTRETMESPWSEAINIGPPVNTHYSEALMTISLDGLELYFSDYGNPRPGGCGGEDLWVTRRASIGAPWTEPENLGPNVNSAANDSRPHISADCLLLFFDSKRPGGYGSSDLYMSRRRSPSDPWGEPVNLGPKINSTVSDSNPGISPDGSELFFAREYDIWQASVDPVVDLNSDGIVDATDMCIIIDNWGTDEPLCDIGPTPFGDGIVDVQDLIVLAEHLFEETTPVE